MVTSIVYLHLDVWMVLSKPPWCYAIGDITANVEALKDAADVSDPIGSKIQTLSRLTFESEVSAALELLRQSSMTTLLVEQAHGSGAQLMHRHPQVGPVVMTSRMTIHNSRVLFAPSQFEKKELAL